MFRQLWMNFRNVRCCWRKDVQHFWAFDWIVLNYLFCKRYFKIIWDPIENHPKFISLQFALRIVHAPRFMIKFLKTHFSSFPLVQTVRILPFPSCRLVLPTYPSVRFTGEDETRVYIYIARFATAIKTHLLKERIRQYLQTRMTAPRWHARVTSSQAVRGNKSGNP